MAGQEAITAQYDRVAPYYRALSPLFLITPWARRKGVDALALRPGDTALEIGAGSGRNLPYLVDAVGPGGAVIGVDLSAGMLAEATKMVARRGWRNVRLIHSDAATVELDRDVDGVLFSLSYSAMPPQARLPAATRAWERLRPGRRLAVMDLGLTETRLRPILDPIARQLIKLGPGHPYVRPWDDLAIFGEVVTDRFMLDLYYVCTVAKRTAFRGRA
ncbi:MAG TPA: class I SAM-dependent methyltransferase [Solirubrobacterales bacterium]|jgi:ubiquinone/menaquinone biosynthesis C-methylase UbiE|nr:class I SAM-dependent methyltransferase [Solirubrobacterales bacterium]